MNRPRTDKERRRDQDIVFSTISNPKPQFKNESKIDYFRNYYPYSCEYNLKEENSCKVVIS